MGEAKRRKQFDSQYGKVISLSSQNQQQHVDRLLDRLSEEFELEIKEIGAAETLIEPYEAYRQKVTSWVDRELAAYQPQDRTFIASSIMTCYAEIAMKYDASPLLIKFWFDVLRSRLSPEKLPRLEAISNKIAADFGVVDPKQETNKGA